MVKRSAAVQFVLAGSVLVKQPAFAREVRRRLLKLWPRAKVVTLEREAVWGALELARGAAVAPKAAVTVALPIAALPTSTALSPTEQRNPRSMKLHELSLEKAIALMIDEETAIGPALRHVRPEIQRALELVIKAFQDGGRLFYVGAGTSGRLGVLDASECPPTFRVPAQPGPGIIAGGQTALWSAVEGMEDDPKAGAAALAGRGVTHHDVVMGIAASGRTPFVWGALEEARRRRARTILLCFNPHLKIPEALQPDVVIAADVGPEVLTGSTRLKSGTATKIILNTPDDPRHGSHGQSPQQPDGGPQPLERKAARARRPHRPRRHRRRACRRPRGPRAFAMGGQSGVPAIAVIFRCLLTYPSA